MSRTAETAVEQQGAWDVRVVIERKGVAAQSGIEAISAVTAQLDREGIVVAEVHAHRTGTPAVETRAGELGGGTYAVDPTKIP